MKNYVHIPASTTRTVGSYRQADRLVRIIIIPRGSDILNVGNVSIKDGDDDAIVVYNEVNQVPPTVLNLGLSSQNGWSIITGANVEVIVIID